MSRWAGWYCSPLRGLVQVRGGGAGQIMRLACLPVIQPWSRRPLLPAGSPLNYLAHLYLAGHQADHLLGSLLGDFMRGQDLADFPSAVQDGVLHHRAVDRFTDGHAVFARSRARLAPQFRRVSGIVIDVFYDHLLARSWARWSEQPLAEFTAEIYALLQARRAELPPRMQRAVDYMVRGDWLGSYVEPLSIDWALRGLSSRMRRANPLGEAYGELAQHGDGLRRDFEQFFPELRARHGSARR